MNSPRLASSLEAGGGNLSLQQKRKDRVIKWTKWTWCQEFPSLRSELKFGEPVSVSLISTRSTASWSIAHCVSYCSFKVDWNLNLIFIFFFKKKRKLEIFQALNFYNAALNYAGISQLFISVAVCYGHALKSMQKWEWAKHAASTHFTQNRLLERFVSQCRFHIFLWASRTVPVTEAIPVFNCCVSRAKQILILRSGQCRLSLKKKEKKVP